MDGRELRQYERWKDEVQHLRMDNRHLRLELMALRPESYRADQKIDRLQQRNEKLKRENKLLKQRIADLTLQLRHKPAPPAFVKANAAVKVRRTKPGRRVGHVAALRPMPGEDRCASGRANADRHRRQALLPALLHATQ
jgi:cell division protein FtsB